MSGTFFIAYHVWFMNGSARTSYLDLASFSNTNWEAVAVGYFSGTTDNYETKSLEKRASGCTMERAIAAP